MSALLQIPGKSVNITCEHCWLLVPTHYCTCTGTSTPSYLCSGCLPAHLEKSPNLHHSIVKVSVEVANLSAFRSRNEAFAEGRTELFQNLTKVDQCCVDLMSAVDYITTRLGQYRDTLLGQLQAWKQTLNNEISQCVYEVESTLTQEQVQLKGQYSEALRHFKAGSLVLFNYKVDTSAIENCIQYLYSAEYPKPPRIPQKDVPTSPPGSQPIFGAPISKETGPAITPALKPTLPWTPAQGAPAKLGPIYFQLPPPPPKAGVPAAVSPNPAISAPMKPSHPPIPVAPVSPIAAPAFTAPSSNPVFLPKAGPNIPPPPKPMLTPYPGKPSLSGTESQPVVVSPVQSGAAKPAFSPFTPAAVNVNPSLPAVPGGKLTFQLPAVPSSQGQKPSFQPLIMKQSQPVAPAPQQGGFVSPVAERQPSQDQQAGPFSRKSGEWVPFSQDQVSKPANQPTSLPSTSPMNPKPSTAAGSDFKVNIPLSAQGSAGPSKWIGQPFPMQPKGPQPSEAYRPDPAVAGPDVGGKSGAMPLHYAIPSDAGKMTPPPCQLKPSTQVFPAKPGPVTYLIKSKCQICQLDREKDLIYREVQCVSQCAVCIKCMATAVAGGKKQCPKCARALSDVEVEMMSVYGQSIS